MQYLTGFFFQKNPHFPFLQKRKEINPESFARNKVKHFAYNTNALPREGSKIPCKHILYI